MVYMDCGEGEEGLNQERKAVYWRFRERLGESQDAWCYPLLTRLTRTKCTKF